MNLIQEQIQADQVEEEQLEIIADLFQGHQEMQVVIHLQKETQVEQGNLYLIMQEQVVVEVHLLQGLLEVPDKVVLEEMV
jgi:hypothetical protein